jgi:cytoskeletal protein RodZ
MRPKHGSGAARVAGRELALDAGTELERPAISVYLRRQRELRGISVEDLAVLTRIPLRSLERLEGGHFDNVVDGFVRGFVRTVALALGLDPDDTLSRMLSEPRLADSAQLEVSRALPRAMVGLVVIALMAALLGVVRWVVDSETSPRVGLVESEIVHRLDPVRALAESQAASQVAAPPSPDSPPSNASTEGGDAVTGQSMIAGPP